MTSNMEQIERIERMEAHFDIAKDAVARLIEALERYEEAKPDIVALEDYYDNGTWRKDFEADEAGLLPRDMKRGVLSEDGVWNLLTDNNDLRKRLRRAAKA